MIKSKHSLYKGRYLILTKWADRKNIWFGRFAKNLTDFMEYYKTTDHWKPTTDPPTDSPPNNQLPTTNSATGPPQTHQPLTTCSSTSPSPAHWWPTTNSRTGSPPTHRLPTHRLTNLFTTDHQPFDSQKLF